MATDAEILKIVFRCQNCRNKSSDSESSKENVKVVMQTSCRGCYNQARKHVVQTLYNELERCPGTTCTFCPAKEGPKEVTSKVTKVKNNFNRKPRRRCRTWGESSRRSRSPRSPRKRSRSRRSTK